ncbi:MAG: SurA N-terminal domain-containing protein [Planctomycetota bacterium]|jgi:hypothetical protein
MRRLAWIVLLAAFAGAQEGDAPSTVPEHDELGFPITFNDDIITESDVERSLGQRRENVPPITFKNERDVMLKRKLSEEIAAKLGIVVPEEEVDAYLRREMEAQGGEAKFYESLAQQGLTLEGHRNNQRQLILHAKLRYMFQHGVTADQQKLLPHRIRPTPREIRIAAEHDPARRDAGIRVRRLELIVDIDKRARQKVIARMLKEGKDEEWLKQELAAAVEPVLQQVRKELKGGKPFPEVAKERGVDVDALRELWIEVAREPSEDPVERFLQTAEINAVSDAYPRPGGGYRIVSPLARERPEDRSVKDPEVARAYEGLIRALRATKWQAHMHIQALDRSTVRPERVRESMRTDLLAELRDAEGKLRALGLH